MGRSFGGTLLRLLVGGIAVLFALAVVGTVVGLVVGILSAVFTAVVLLGLLVLVGGTAAALLSLFGGDGGRSRDDTDWFDVDTDVSVGTTGREPTGGVGGIDAPDDTASEAARLRERYVAGELDEAEFERRLDRLLDDTGTDGDDREPAFDR